ncbi:hypothetical protein ACA910_001824 [Epithemia clementina (nom. ined.)]
MMLSSTTTNIILIQWRASLIKSPILKQAGRIGATESRRQRLSYRLFSTTTTTTASQDEPFYGFLRPTKRPLSSTLAPVLLDSVASLLEQVSHHLSPGSSSSSPSPTSMTNDSATNTTLTSTTPSTNRLVLLLREATIALRDPTRADAVATIGELTGSLALQELRQVMKEHPIGRRILDERPVVSKDSIPYQQLLDQAQQTMDNDYRTLTFGQAYGRFLWTHGFDPDERCTVRYLSSSNEQEEEEELAYIMLRYRQSHDFYHALTGLPPTVLGELALKWLELFQTGLPMTAFAGTFGGLLTLSSRHEQDLLWNVYLPWAQRVGRRRRRQTTDSSTTATATPTATETAAATTSTGTVGAPFGALLNVYYEKEWDTPLMDLQQRIGIEMAPPLPS